MFEILKLLHVVGWAAWFGLAIAEASVGVQTRKADAAVRPQLARLWLRVGKVQVGAALVAVFMGLLLLAYELATFPGGGAAYMRDPGHLFVHLMLALGLVAAVLALLAAGARSKAAAELDANGEAAFLARYKRAAMFSGMASLLLLATLALVYLRTL